MLKIKKIIATFIGSFLIGSSSKAITTISPANPVEAKIHNIIKALQDKNIQGEKSKMFFEYLEKNHNLNSIEIGKPKNNNEDPNTGNWDNWNNWNTWNNWSNWDTWNNWNNWNTWSNWSNY
jgi:hypothetical protein